MQTSCYHPQAHSLHCAEIAAAEQGWLLAQARKPAHTASRRGEVLELDAGLPLHRALLLLRRHPQGEAQCSFPAAVLINAWFISKKWGGLLHISHFLFHNYSLSMACSTSWKPRWRSLTFLKVKTVASTTHESFIQIRFTWTFLKSAGSRKMLYFCSFLMVVGYNRTRKNQLPQEVMTKM